MRHVSRASRLCALAAATALFVAACGDDSDNGSSPDSTATTAATTGATAADASSADTPGETVDTAATSADGSAATGDLTANDATDGESAEAWEAALREAEQNPLKAEGEEIIIAMPNLEGSAGGSFPDTREGAEAALQLINDKLGGVGADIAAGKPGRPIRFEVCAHKLDQSEAQACATEIQEANPSLIIVGTEFFTPLMYPLWEGIPAIHTVPIFLADFDQPGVYAFNGGGATQIAGQVQYQKDVLKADRVAVLLPDLAPAHEMNDDTWQPLLEAAGLDQQTFLDKVGDPSDDAANIEAMMSYLEGADNPVIAGVAGAADCAAYLKGLATAGNTAPIVWAQSCVDASVVTDPSAEGVTFGFETYIADDADLSPFVQYELAQRQQAIDDFGPTAPVSTFMLVGFSAAAWAYQVMNEVAADGGDPSDRAAIAAALAEADNAHIVGSPPVNCLDVAAAYRSICGRSITFATWDGSRYVPDAALGGEYLDVTDLLAARPPRS